MIKEGSWIKNKITEEIGIVVYSLEDSFAPEDWAVRYKGRVPVEDYTFEYEAILETIREGGKYGKNKDSGN